MSELPAKVASMMTHASAPFALGDRVSFGASWVGTVTAQWTEVFPARPREEQWVVRMRSLSDPERETVMRAEHLHLIERDTDG